MTEELFFTKEKDFQMFKSQNIEFDRELCQEIFCKVNEWAFFGKFHDWKNYIQFKNNNQL